MGKGMDMYHTLFIFSSVKGRVSAVFPPKLNSLTLEE